ncbi:MAG: thiamine diphosphokinase [Bacteroidales bacterium]|nr:thiamine diphosphokinase [Bacteroidales bacterium]
MSQPKTIAIVAAGEFPRRSAVLRLLDEADMIICCDSAAAALVDSGREPSLIVGDLDSIPASLLERFPDRLRKVDEQEDNDLTKAFYAAMEFSPSCIHILGATGLREDHTLGNISLLARYQQEAGPSCRIDMVSDYGVFLAASGEHTFACRPGQEVSIFAFDNTLRISASGLQYPTDSVVFDSLWKATLNVATGDSFTISPSNDSFYLVYLSR